GLLSISSSIATSRVATVAHRVLERFIFFLLLLSSSLCLSRSFRRCLCLLSHFTSTSYILGYILGLDPLNSAKTNDGREGDNRDQIRVNGRAHESGFKVDTITYLCVSVSV